jgi:hypothetical protein
VLLLDDWEKEWGKIHNEVCLPICCRWISGRRWLPPRNRINGRTLREAKWPSEIESAFLVKILDTVGEWAYSANLWKIKAFKMPQWFSFHNEEPVWQVL